MTDPDAPVTSPAGGAVSAVARRTPVDVPLLCAALLCLAGYLLPWVQVRASYDWWYSGWSYATLSTGPGWTAGAIVWFVLAAGASVGAGRSAGLATTASACGAAGVVWALAVLAASYADIGPHDTLNEVSGLPLGVGLPVLALGAGVLLVASIRSIALHVLRDR